MTRRLQARRLLKWSGLFVLLLIFLAWVLSLRWHFGWATLDRSGYHFSVIFQIGAIYTTYVELHGEDLDGWYWGPDNFYPEFISFPRILLKPRFELLGSGSWFFNLPLWIPFVIVAVPTVYLWWRDYRRIPPHCCQTCAYDLTGNVSGVCPECGARIAD